MPIYEFYCVDCHRIFSFLSRRVDTDKRPACPRCGRAELSRRASSFAVSKGRREEPRSAAPAAAGFPPGMDEGRLSHAMEALGREAEGLDEEDPRQAARLMRRLFDTAGLPMGTGMEEALRRMEAGEDPEKIEEQMGDLLEDPLPGVGDAGEPPEGKKSLAAVRRRVMPPSVDPTLYEL